LEGEGRKGKKNKKQRKEEGEKAISEAQGRIV